MALSADQIDYLEKLCLSLSLDSLVQLKKGNIKGIKDFDTKMIDPDLIAEHKEMKEIIKKYINLKNRKKSS
ncbi:MAG: hypothetical protein Q8N03_06585 [Ignavibacteria bacterium]|nr:hypothetical protein [Ignavibacteria bacterium]MDP3830348.1 hypothetical protein [Ignavibacteriaceae bacterium]